MRRKLQILCILMQLHTVHPVGMILKELLLGCHEEGFTDLDERSLLSLLDDMESHDLVSMKTDRLDATLKHWKRTEEGRVQLKEANRI
ncbi:MAG: hypothetical protein V4662_25030 [Verrucomicrobiota bacterium]